MKYIGITIGPIIDTMMDASSPATLWFASSLFSDVTRRLCERILEEKDFGKVTIYSPYFTSNDIGKKASDGIGRYHDRIIFGVEQFDKEKLDTIIRLVKKNTADIFLDDEKKAENETFFEGYIQIHYCVLDENDERFYENYKRKNCILVLGSYLDSLELMQTFPVGRVSHNPLLDVFLQERIEDDHSSSNSKIKELRLFRDITDKDKNQLKKGNGIRKIDNIASNNNLNPDCLKYSRYFAVVSADGDKVGTVLSGISDEKVTAFSQRCLEYSSKAAELVRMFGGMTIYAGGDDLLFLAPVIGGKDNNETVFELCGKINKLFKDSMEDLSKDISISFGIAIQYYKYPLYEAFEKSRSLLERIKKRSNKKPNSQMIYLQKHSGQSMQLLLSNNNVDGLKRFFLHDNHNDGMSFFEKEDKMIQSILYTLRNYEGYIQVLFNNAKRSINPEKGKAEFETGWMNLFDNDEQKKSEGYIKSICSDVFDEIIVKKGIQQIEDNNDVTTVFAVLQLKKFLIEKVSQEEKG